jgi:hypothetical protein
VSIIMDEPTCKAFKAINNGLADIETQGWGDFRDRLGPPPSWTPDQRMQMERVTTAMRNAAEQSVALARQTPHRVMRELYEQFIAYGRAYADRLENYTPSVNELASANVSAGSAINGVCNAIELGSTSRSLAFQPEGPPSSVDAPTSIDEPIKFVDAMDAPCTEWIDNLDAFTAATPQWQVRDGAVPASQWTPDRRAVEEAVRPLLTDYASKATQIGRNSGNAVFEDFSVASSLYIRAFVTAGDDYNAADSWLNYTGFRIANLVAAACRAATG